MNECYSSRTIPKYTPDLRIGLVINDNFRGYYSSKSSLRSVVNGLQKLLCYDSKEFGPGLALDCLKTWLEDLQEEEDEKPESERIVASQNLLVWEWPTEREVKGTPKQARC